MKVVILIDLFHPFTGGGERQMENLGRALMERGVEVIVVTRRFSGLAAYERVRGVPVRLRPMLPD